MFFTLKSKITSLFAIACLAIMALFFVVNMSLRQAAINEDLGKISLIAQSIASLSNDPERTSRYLRRVKFQPIDLMHKDVQRALSTPPQLTQLAKFGQIHVHYSQNKFFLEIMDSMGTNVYYSDVRQDRYRLMLLGACLATLLVLAMIYVFISRSLLAINRLANSMNNWSYGLATEVACTNRSDEIGRLARACADATDRIDHLICSRQLFLRSVMHELKTPLGKGRIIASLPASPTNMQRLDAIFTRLELLINEFGQAERVLSRYYKPQMGEYRCSLLYEQALDILMLDDTSIICADFGEDKLIRVDMQLFSLMLKNLIDNAIKYSTGGPIFVRFDDEALSVQNRGKELAAPINDLMQAFRQGDSKKPGLGLGLYLIDRIAMLHGCKLVHNYDGFNHIFKIIKDSSIQLESERA